MLRIERVADMDRDTARNRRRHGLRMDDLGAEIRELHRLVVGQLVDHGRLRHQARIAAHDAVHIGPDGDRLGFQQAGQNGG